jgi:hypothetical protein
MRSLLVGEVVVASLALAGNGAMAATTHVTSHVTNHVTKHVALPRHAVTARHYPLTRQPADFAQFMQGLFGGQWPAQVFRGTAASHVTRGTEAAPPDWSAPYDNSSDIAAISAAQAAQQAASDAENQAIQQMNDTNAMTASMAAAEQQNDAANAAALQTEINAGM